MELYSLYHPRSFYIKFFRFLPQTVKYRLNSPVCYTILIDVVFDQLDFVRSVIHKLVLNDVYVFPRSSVF